MNKQSNKKQKSRKRAEAQAKLNRMDHRFGESPSHDDPKLQILPIYKEPVKFCISLFREGRHMSDAVYLTRLYFTDPHTPGYIPNERWDALTFRSMLIRWIKAD